MPDALTLWDLIKTALRPRAAGRAPQARPRARRPARTTPRPGTMEARYDEITRSMLQLHGIRVRRWRKAMTGIAWQVRYHNGNVARLIEAPRPCGPMSAAIFLHEVGHHVIGFNTYRPRCLEEFHAWEFAIRQMHALGLNITEAVLRRRHLSLRYAVDKARRRGLTTLPSELEPYTGPWRGTPSRPRGARTRRTSR